jgi:hypothetical protein
MNLRNLFAPPPLSQACFAGSDPFHSGLAAIAARQHTGVSFARI